MTNSRPTGLRSLSGTQGAFLLLVVIAGTALRLWYQVDRPFTGDESGSLLQLSRGYGELLTTFGEPWLSMPFFLALTKALAAISASNTWVMILPSLAAGVATIPLTASLALRVAPAGTALASACLVAGNPYLVHYSVQLRSYMLMAAFALGALLLFLDWQARGDRRLAWGSTGCGVLAVLMHANAVYFALFMGILFLLWPGGPSGLRARLRQTRDLRAPALVAAVLLIVTYAPLVEDMQTFRGRWRQTPPGSLDYVPWVFGHYFARGFAALPSLVLLGWGVWHGSQRNRRLLLLALAAVVPATAISLLGISQFPWGYARYLIASLPLLLVILAAGAMALPGLGARAGAAAIAVVLASWIPGLQERFDEKERYPWNLVASHLEAELRPNDVILTLNAGNRNPQVALTPLVPGIEGHFQHLAGFTRRSQPGARIVVINPDEPIVTDADQRSLGSVQVVTYGGMPRREMAETLLRDLRLSTSARVAPGLTGHYLLIRALLAELSLPDVRGRSAALYFRCLMLTEHHLNKAPHLRDPSVDMAAGAGHERPAPRLGRTAPGRQ